MDRWLWSTSIIGEQHKVGLEEEAKSAESSFSFTATATIITTTIA